MFEQAYAVVSVAVWGFSPIYYRTFMQKFDFLALNFLRTSIAAAVLAGPRYGRGAARSSEAHRRDRAHTSGTGPE